MRCHNCRTNWPLFMFRKDNMKYKIAAWKGKICTCRICSFKISKEPVVRYRNKKFIIVQLSLIERLKEFFRK